LSEVSQVTKHEVESDIGPRLVMQRALRFRQGIILSLIALASTAQAQDDIPGAQRYLTECLRVARDSGGRLGLARSFEACAELREPNDSRTQQCLSAPPTRCAPE
jgi:hypothetical protein